MTEQNREEMVARAREWAGKAAEWLSTEEGKAKLADTLRESSELTEQLEKDMRVDPAILKEPMTRNR